MNVRKCLAIGLIAVVAYAIVLGAGGKTVRTTSNYTMTPLNFSWNTSYTSSSVVSWVPPVIVRPAVDCAAYDIARSYNFRDPYAQPGSPVDDIARGKTPTWIFWTWCR